MMVEFDFSQYSPEEIIGKYVNKVSSSSSPWENEIIKFIQEWLSPEPYILAKTSGSTGTPKELLLKKVHMEASARMTAEFLSLQRGQTALLNLPLRYIAGKMMLVRSIVCQFRLIAIPPSSTPLQGLEIPIDFGAMVPNQVIHSLDSLSQIGTLLIGGGPIHSELEEKLFSLSGNIFHTYGMTETVTHVAMRRINGPKQTLYFQALPHVKFQQDERGCLVIDAPGVSDNPQHTHDVVDLLSPTRFIWKGRADHVILSGGIKIHPEEVEKLLEHIMNQRFFVAGKPDPILGEKLILVVEGEPSHDTSLGDRISDLPISPYHIPKEVVFTKKFEETATGKVQRKKTLAALNL